MFQLHPQLDNDCFTLGRFELCRLLMMNDASYPWFILVPERSELREIHHLDEGDQQQLISESSALASAIETAFAAEKINVAALGNLVPQLHIHHIARYASDPSWPAPVWGKHPAKPYNDRLRDERIEQLLDQLQRPLYPVDC
ncbi:diadenosine tetraphosphate hydrolase [Solemya pervernicosa gill symbiont]|uniref:Diadenosine tetraphosphate hydrolase n=1 Tax=Solemya pervernicosa gill symbiont TaxID=642797 RepID=A0A1T2L814_9GAMM|nr:HIT domain-containing protein [Solemya pervernicosa gill symbiont]OOZ41247.1 diadenosine tetraphosphate hydrolase [Solemya pervernicosa gill symbiont]